MSKTSPHIYISAGEASGDLLGAELTKSLRQKNPNIIFTGMGGPQMAKAGVSIQFDCNRLSVVGLTEIIAHLPDIFSMLRAIKCYLAEKKPDLVIFIDFPDTHIRISKMAKKLNIPVLYYVSPQVWAWRPKRLKQLKKTVDHMAVLFPFEKKLYQDKNIPVTVVGHPLARTVKPNIAPENIHAFFNLNPNKLVIALFPGSRQGEIKRHLPILIEAATRIHQENPNVQFIMPLAQHCDIENIRTKLPEIIQPIQGHLYDVLQITHAAVAVSGTVTLEIACMQVPLCIIYRLHPITYCIVKPLMRIEHYGLCNIVAEKLIAKEFIQKNATPLNIATEILLLLNNKSYHAKMKADLKTVKENLGDGNASDAVADIAMRLHSNA